MPTLRTHYPARLWLALAWLPAAVLGGCVTQDYVRSTGQSAASGAMQGVSEGIPSIQEPLRQTLRGALVDDSTLRDAAREMTDSALQVLQARLASPEMRQQVDALVAQAMTALARQGDETVRALITAAGTQVETEMRAVATQSILAATTTLRGSVERDVSPATQRLAKRMADQLIVSLVEGLEGPLQDRLQIAGRNMAQALIKGADQGADDPINQAGFGGLTSPRRGSKIWSALPSTSRTVRVSRESSVNELLVSA